MDGDIEDRFEDGHVVVACRSYTKARNTPNVIGKLGNTRIPFGPYSTAQIVVFLLSIAVLLMTRRIWGFVFRGPFAVLFLFGVSGGLVFVMRHARPEGRTPIQYLGGLATLVVSPRYGTAHGRRLRRPAITEARIAIPAAPTREEGG